MNKIRRTSGTRIMGVIATLSFTMVGGCVGTPHAPFTLLAALDVPDAPAGDPLFAAGSSTYLDGVDMADAVYWRVGYRSQNGDTSVFRILPSGEVSLYDADSKPALAVKLPAIDLKGLLDSPEALAVGQAAGAIPSEFQQGDQLFYWLAAEHGRAAWLLVYNGVSSSSVVLLDARDGRILERPLQIDYARALNVAQVHASAWNPSAALRGVSGLERGVGGLTFALFDHGGYDGVLAPSDPRYLDGLAPSWVFQYVAAGSDEALVLNVLAGGLVLEGVVPINGAGPALGLYEYDPEDLVNLFQDDVADRPVRYQHRATGDEVVWEILQASGDNMEVFRMDAASGAKVCGPCTRP